MFLRLPHPGPSSPVITSILWTVERDAGLERPSLERLIAPIQVRPRGGELERSAGDVPATGATATKRDAISPDTHAFIAVVRVAVG